MFKLSQNWMACQWSENLKMCDVLHDLIPFIQFKIRGKHLWRSITFVKLQTERWHSSNFSNGTKSRKASHMKTAWYWHLISPGYENFSAEILILCKLVSGNLYQNWRRACFYKSSFTSRSRLCKKIFHSIKLISFIFVKIHTTVISVNFKDLWGVFVGEER